MIIGYQGDVGSNSYAVYKEMYKNEEGIPLYTSKNVIEALEQKSIDVGILAIRNSIAGTVLETEIALRDVEYEILACIDHPIHHYLYIKDKTSSIEEIASHPQALKQTKNYIQRHYPNARTKEYIDTALAAKDLCNGVLPSTTAVICPYEAGKLYGLYLIGENIEDKENNKTTFLAIRLK